MRTLNRLVNPRWLLLTPLVLASCTFAAPPAGLPSQEAILPILEKNADAQLAAMNGKAPADWTAAAFYVGLARLSHVSSNPKYTEALSHIAEANKWEIKSNKGNNRRFHADDQAIGQMYIDLALTKKNPDLLKPLIAEQTALLEQLTHYKIEVSNPAVTTRPDIAKLEVIPWWWCDALFMSPAVLSRLSAVTGDNKFLDGMDKAWDQTHELLYDKEEHLYYRDNRFPGMKSANGKKVFWGRGNGWVMGGLAETLSYMPKDYPARPKYEALFKEMCEKLLTLQGEDGCWRASLEDAAEQPHPESSGTAFFTYAFAWGINNGLLDRAKYEPAMIKGWRGLVKNLRPDGQLGYVQQVGFKPDPTKPEDTQYYGNGAFLLAGTEIIKLSSQAK